MSTHPGCISSHASTWLASGASSPDSILPVAVSTTCTLISLAVEASSIICNTTTTLYYNNYNSTTLHILDSEKYQKRYKKQHKITQMETPKQNEFWGSNQQLFPTNYCKNREKSRANLLWKRRICRVECTLKIIQIPHEKSVLCRYL